MHSNMQHNPFMKQNSSMLFKSSDRNHNQSQLNDIESKNIDDLDSSINAKHSDRKPLDDIEQEQQKFNEKPKII